MRPKRRVVVTGLGVATPIGIGIEPFWDAMIQRRCGVRRITAFDPSGFAAQLAGELSGFSFGDYIPKNYRKSAKVMARDIVLALICAYHAVKDAGLKTKCLIERDEAAGPPNVDSRRFGANIGAGLICADLNELAGALSASADESGRFSLAHWGVEGMGNLTPLWLLKFLPNMLACHVTIVHDAQGASNTITCAEASSHLAIGEAFRTISRGDAEVCICGGAESKVNPMSLARPLLWGRLNTRSNDSPEQASRPFATNRRGMVIAEGGGLVILESLEHAKTRGARIYAEVVGFGAGTNTFSWSQPDPQGRAVETALNKSLADAKVSAEAVHLVNPLGTGVAAYDSGEIAAWNRVFGPRLDQAHALCTRGGLGNSGAGAGAIDFAATVMALHHRTIPASVGTAELEPGCRFRFVQDDPIDARLDYAASVGYALAGGQAGALVIRRFQE